MSRPTKLPMFLEKMKKVLNDPRSVILTDVELLVAVNQKLKKSERVAISTFELWKSKKITEKSPENNTQIDDDTIEEFRQTLAFARVEQKMNLTGNMLDEKNKNQWGASWLLERKYEDLKNRPQVQLNSNPTIMIQAGDKEGQKMIDSIINGTVIDIEHEEIKENRLIQE